MSLPTRLTPAIVLILGAVAVASPAAPARFAAETDTTATAPVDTVPTLPGLFLPEGIEPEDILPAHILEELERRRLGWTELDGADPDSLLRAGLGVVLAFEDTFSFDPGTSDTILVNAPRVSIGEVIEAIGRRMEAEDAAMRNVEFTTLSTIVERDVPSRMGDDYKVTEIAERQSDSDERGRQTVRLWKRERTVADGEVVEEEVDEEQETSWDDMETAMMMALPFSRGSGDRYNYDITARDLVGNSLIYRIDFTPKSRFEALPSGTVWVDYSHWVIRKLEARMTDVVPLPIVLKGIPVFRLSRERIGEYWFTTDVNIEIHLRKLPLIDIPRVVEIRTQIRDVVINGLARRPDSLVPRRLRHGNLNPEEFWLSPEASEDSLRAYWDGLANIWRDDLTPALQPVELSEAKVDSLTRAGSDVLAEMAAASPWKLDLRPVQVPGFNRVQGFVTRVGAVWRHRGPIRPRLGLNAGYAFGNRRPEFAARLRVPVLRGETRQLEGRDDATSGLLALTVAGWKGVTPFAGDDRPGTRRASSFFYGGDPNQYLESRGGRARLDWNPGTVRLWAEAAYFEDRTLEQSTTWNLFGRALRPTGNLPAHELDDRRLSAGAEWTWGPLTLDGSVTAHSAGGYAGAVTGARYELTETRARLGFELLDALGNAWVARGRYRGFDGQAPRQWRAWLGDFGSLRGYPAGVLTGDRGAWASIDLRLGVDLFKSLRLPGFKSLGLQPLLFADHGQAWAEPGPLPDETRTGHLWDAGFGFGKRLDLPFSWGFPNVRLYAAHPVGPGTGDDDWRVLLAFEK